MPYSAMTYRLLMSAPGDVPRADFEAIERAITRWNAVYGRQFGAVVVATHWRQHSAAEHGQRPQASLNEQLVDDADALVALFWSRLGTPTGEAESGTREELERAHANGAYVAVLRCERDVDPTSLDSDQIAALGDYLDELRPDSLILGYRDEADLSRHIDTILTRVVTRQGDRAEAAAEESGSEGADVWPRVETRENVKTDSRGRVKTDRRWSLVISNTGPEPATDVRFRLEPEEEGELPPEPFDADRPLETLAPRGGEASYGLLMHSGIAAQARCVVTWHDSTGDGENVATLRFY